MSIWKTEGIEEHAVKRWNEGASASEIGRELSAMLGRKVTRNAVIGRMFRMGLTRPKAVARFNTIRLTPHGPRGGAGELRVARQRAARPPKPLKPKTPNYNLVAINAVRRQEAKRTFTPPPAPPVDASHARPWVTRQFGECAFPVSGQGADTLSCCAKTPEGATYCEAHRLIMINPVQPKRRDTNRLARWAA